MQYHMLLRFWTSFYITLSLSHISVQADLLASREGPLTREALDYGVDDTTTEDDFFQFVTRPDIKAPRWNITVYDEDALAPGYWWVAPYTMLDQEQRGEAWVGPYIYDGNGELIWSGVPLFDRFDIFDFRPIEIRGEQMFTAIYKREDAAVLVDNNYQIRKMVKWTGGYDGANMHEFTLFDDATKAAVFTREEHHLSKEKSQKLGYDGNCFLVTYRLLELDITTTPPRTLFNWSLIDHISLDETTFPSEPNIDEDCKTGWDSLHCNAIDRFDSGDYLISCRHTDALYRISRETGSMVWRLGGTKSDFTFADNAIFSRQHHARILKENETHTLITLFDNARAGDNDATTHDYTRGLVLSLHDNVAEVFAEYARPDHGYSTSRGSLEILPNGNAFIGWSFHTRISEHTADERLLMEAKLPPKKNTYRSYKSPWIGRPGDPPDVWSHAVGSGSGHRFRTEVYVSWNGATEVKKWNLYKSNPQGDKIELLKSVPKTGFETSTNLDEWIHYIVVEAIDKAGTAIGQSKVIETIPPDRNVTDFVEEKEWEAEHIPSVSNDQIQQQGKTYLGYSNESQQGDGGTWNENLSLLRRPTILAYVGGFCTCFLAFVFCWAGFRVQSKIRRRWQNQGYMQVDKDEREDDYELDEGIDKAYGRKSNESSSSDYVKDG